MNIGLSAGLSIGLGAGIEVGLHCASFKAVHNYAGMTEGLKIWGDE